MAKIRWDAIAAKTSTSSAIDCMRASAADDTPAAPNAVYEAAKKLLGGAPSSRLNMVAKALGLA